MKSGAGIGMTFMCSMIDERVGRGKKVPYWFGYTRNAGAHLSARLVRLPLWIGMGEHIKDVVLSVGNALDRTGS